MVARRRLLDRPGVALPVVRGVWRPRAHCVPPGCLLSQRTGGLPAGPREAGLRAHRLRPRGPLWLLDPGVAQLEPCWRSEVLDALGVDGLRFRFQVRGHPPQHRVPAAVPHAHGPLQLGGPGAGDALRALAHGGGVRGEAPRPAGGAGGLGEVLGHGHPHVPDVPHAGRPGSAPVPRAGAGGGRDVPRRLPEAAPTGTSGGSCASTKRPVRSAVVGHCRPH
mmetsp:Transcript_48361/g.154454  ORF Transcript_48361/g.154454 Transcript_48361/m.154454 type:complete len:221 (-) Transcript_48361:457-1119(-)